MRHTLYLAASRVLTLAVAILAGCAAATPSEVRSPAAQTTAAPQLAAPETPAPAPAPDLIPTALPPQRDNRQIPAAHILPQSGPATLPTVDCGGYFLVQITIDGKGPFNFVLDTGATHTAISQRLARELAKDVTPVEGTVRGVDGAADQNLGLVTLDRVAAGEFAALDLDVLVLDLRSLSATFGVRLDGILGYSFFDGVLLTVDYPRRQVRAQRGQLPPTDGKRILRATRRSAPYVEARIGDRRVDLLLDTGKSGGMTLDDLSAFPSDQPPTPIGSAVGISGTFLVRAARLRDDARVGDLVLKRPVAVESRGASIVGVDALKQFSLTFDPRGRRVRFDAPAGSPLPPVVFPPVRGIGMAFSYSRGAWLIGELFENSPARDAGVRTGDLPIRINGRRLGELKCSRIEDLYSAQSVELELIRDFRERLKITVPVRVIVP